jgi:hypothetical protein
MTDAIFNTLAAVAVMCSGHFQGVLGIDGLMPDPDRGTFAAGFEQCGTVIKELTAEKQRRAAEQADEKVSQDKARLANGLAALKGKSFAPEAAPIPPKSALNCYSLGDIHPL